MCELKIRSESRNWQALDFEGISMKTLRMDDDTGGMVVLTRMEAGAKIPAHMHSRADETVFVVEGDFIEDGEDFQSGSLFFGKAGTVHGPHRTKTGSLLLTTFSAELDFQLVES